MQLNDWLTATLSVVTIALAILGLAIAIAAIFGYLEIMRAAKKAAIKAASDVALKYIKSPEVLGKLRQESRKIIAKEFEKYKEGIELATSQPPQSAPQGGVDTEKVGLPYTSRKRRSQ